MGLSKEQVHAIGLMASGPEMSKKEIAEKVGVSRRTIYNWLDNDEFRDTLQRTPEEHVKDALWLKAIEGDTTAADKWLKYYGEKREDAPTALDEAMQMSPEELEEIRQKIVAHYQAEGAAFT